MYHDCCNSKYSYHDCCYRYDTSSSTWARIHQHAPYLSYVSTTQKSQTHSPYLSYVSTTQKSQTHSPYLSYVSTPQKSHTHSPIAHPHTLTLLRPHYTTHYTTCLKEHDRMGSHRNQCTRTSHHTHREGVH